MNFQLSPEMDKNKVFLIQHSDLDGRLDPFCYIPSLVKLDNKLKFKTNYCLKDFSIFRASGATPNKNNDELYSDKKNGIPFIRVQNLSVTGELDQNDLIYISKDTHKGLLKRSKIQEYDLLVKITGVGRMAVASVAPDGFEGNINQHIVVIRTQSKEISENIAAFLNLDVVEKIATKRATGGTRPALDYPALFSIPVVNDRVIYTKIQKAVSVKKQKEAEAQRLLDSIDNYLLGELGIGLPKQTENTLQSRIFTRRLSEVSGKRFNPDYYKFKYIDVIKKSKYEITKIKDECIFINGYAFKSDDYVTSSNTTLITIKNISDNGIALENITYLPDNYYKCFNGFKIFKNDLLIAMTGATIGKVCLFNQDIDALLNQRNGIIRSALLNTVFLFNVLNTKLYKKTILKNSVGGAQPNISASQIMNIKIPLPPLAKQTEIANHITEIRNQAKQLQQQAKAELEQAKKTVESMILGE